MEPQFSDSQLAAAIDLLESISWGDVEWTLTGLEAALALALEAVGHAIGRWEEEGYDRFGDEFTLSAEQVASLDDEWRLAYIARLLDSAAIDYGVSPYAPPPGRNNEGPMVSPASWNEQPGSIASLLRGLNDILYGLPPGARTESG